MDSEGKSYYDDDGYQGPRLPPPDLNYALPSETAPDRSVCDMQVFTQLSGAHAMNADPSAEMLPWFQDADDLIAALVTDKPEDRAVLRQYVMALLEGDNTTTRAIDITGIRPAIVKLAQAGVRKLRMQAARSPVRKSLADLVDADMEKAKKKLVGGKGAWQYAKDEAKKKGKPDSYAAAIANKICGKSMDDGEEKDSAASLTAAEVARKLKEKEKDNNVNKSIRELVEDDLRKAGAGEGSRGGHVVGHTAGGKPIYGTDLDKLQLKGPAKTQSGKSIPSANDPMYGVERQKRDSDAHGNKPLSKETEKWTKQDHEDASEHHIQAHNREAKKHDASPSEIVTVHSAAAKAHRDLAQKKSDAKKSMTKGGGEGSRGGKVVGHSASGAPVYDKAAHHEVERKYHQTLADFHEAKVRHWSKKEGKAAEAYEDKHREQARQHTKLAAQHMQARIKAANEG